MRHSYSSHWHPSCPLTVVCGCGLGVVRGRGGEGGLQRRPGVFKLVTNQTVPRGHRPTPPLRPPSCLSTRCPILHQDDCSTDT